jgi:uncharacterized protein (DUF1501 family)
MLMLSRRQFLGLTGGAAITGAAAWAGFLRKDSDSDSGSRLADTRPRVLVVVQMSGGNDALNTVIPHDGRYHGLRPNLGIPDDKLVALSGETSVGLHPALQPLGGMWDAHQLAVLPCVGFSTDSRSHFDSLDVWWTASPDHKLKTGWIGRWLDATGAAVDNPLVAISLGGGAVPALASERSQSTAINDLNAFRLMAPSGSDQARLAQAFAATASPALTDPLAVQAQTSVTAALRAVDVLSKAGADTTVEGDPPGTEPTGPLSSGLSAAANLIDLDLGTRVLLVSGTGFDTHANQLNEHAQLLDDLAKGVSSFFSTLQKKGHADRVLLVTTSEFGRRAAENGSTGTDHGLGGVHFLAGPGAQGGLHGTVDLGQLSDGDLPVQTDTRSLYAAALDWLGGPSSDVLDGYKDDLHLVNA